MKPELCRESFTTASGHKLERLLVDGQPAALVGAVGEATAKLLASFEREWKWWVLVGGVSGCTWLLRDHSRPTDFPLVLDASDAPVVLLSSQEYHELDVVEPKKRVRTRRSRSSREVAAKASV